MGGFVKLSVDNLDQLQFKAALFLLNVSTFLARWLHSYLFPTEVGTDQHGQFIVCSDGTYMHCPSCSDSDVWIDNQTAAAAAGGR